MSWCKELLEPAGTVMDLNIGAALWLAAQARGRLRIVGPTMSSAAVPSPHPADLMPGSLMVDPVIRGNASSVGQSGGLAT